MGRVAAAVAVVAALAAAPASSAARAVERVGAAPVVPAGSTLLGLLDPGTPLRITLTLRPRDPAALSALATAVSTPGSPRYRRYLRPGQFAHRFGAPAAAVAAVEHDLRARGLRPGPLAANRLSIPVQATVGALERAFDVTFARLRLRSGATTLISSAAPLLGARAAVAVQEVLGLASPIARQPLIRRPARTLIGHARPAAVAHVATGGPQPCSDVSTAGAGQGAYTADQIASAYDFAGLYRAGDLGKGITIGIYELESNDPSDIYTYEACYGINAAISYVPVDGGAGGGPGSGEAAFDIEQAVGLAPKATFIVYQGPNSSMNSPGFGPYDTLSTMVSEDRAQVISQSWGSCEPLEGSTNGLSEATVLEQAATQGQTMIAASGDSGSEDCATGQGLSNLRLAVDDPGSQPFATSVGGTRLSGLGPPPSESVWNSGGGLTGIFSLQNGAGGGGISSLWPMPTYQLQAAGSLGVRGAFSSGAPCAAGGALCREVPDVAADADPNTGYEIYYNGTGSVSGVPAGWQASGGTSGGAPLWAALVADADSSAACGGTSLGFLNPALYHVAGAAYPSYFHDVTSGNNDLSGTNGGRYGAGPGFDLATGLGTPNGAALAGALCAAALRLAPPAAQHNTVGTSVAVRLAASDAPGAALQFTASGLPPGASINPATGRITGRLRRVGSYSISLRVSDDGGNIRTASFPWIVAGPPKLSRVRLGGLKQASPALALTVSASRGAPPIRAIKIALPAGLRFASHPHQLTVRTTGGRAVRFRTSVAHGALTVTLIAPAVTTAVEVRFAAITSDPSLAQTIRRRRGDRLTVTVTAADSGGGSTRLRASVRPSS
jgi:Pro-kumamolisin, activation domain/Putative Ig domain